MSDPVQPDINFTAYNIVNQLGDLWSEQVLSDRWVPVRQATNEEAWDFVADLIRNVAAKAWDYCLDEIEANELNTQEAREGNPYRNPEGKTK